MSLGFVNCGAAAGEASMTGFLVFAGEHYYPNGGWGDFQSAHETAKEAQDAAVVRALADDYDWIQIVDLRSMEIVWRSEV